ncbi:MAG: hypothetical protein A2284_11380 [Deltaproteobacteria bacterium RIFOXYA12_FULL_61_11]|nr:MAG: hypothetical protein A2284_11380 [Deltaproteobacteria bacterium RIFOXYA12_FULL_61_11]
MLLQLGSFAIENRVRLRGFQRTPWVSSASARMRLQPLAPVVLFLFIAGLFSGAAGEARYASASAHQVSHSESSGSSCPHPDDHGKPCGPACPCACCWGHGTTAVFGSVRPSLQPPPSFVLYASWPDDLHPKDVLSRIFHPPRV